MNRYKFNEGGYCNGQYLKIIDSSKVDENREELTAIINCRNQYEKGDMKDRLDAIKELVGQENVVLIGFCFGFQFIHKVLGKSIVYIDPSLENPKPKIVSFKNIYTLENLINLNLEQQVPMDSQISCKELFNDLGIKPKKIIIKLKNKKK
ncbi:hypothetical protein [Tenacibaculum finnmarkense]|uniref:hypothetical protein n=1 Tax=Tenacibaculum finnmarkense TaxID=2781243 RepID=UPI00187B5822|nr:hypothetical protein [Tenacibaculum finnmarkense]MBE7645410.1 hypothetical protein [Tenacibaculum finnmarkense genomovar ulcerans]MCD8409655.1 hypothetical protein [Tenacibaculum finnmarkense genomovar ulcerans]MCG8858883.1 alpha/beta hydrolase [Tenacibaculum finnmarkense]